MLKKCRSHWHELEKGADLFNCSNPGRSAGFRVEKINLSRFKVGSKGQILFPVPRLAAGSSVDAWSR